MGNKYVEDAVLAMVQDAPWTKEGFAEFARIKIMAAVQMSIVDDRAQRPVEGLTKPTVRLPSLLAVVAFCQQANGCLANGQRSWSSDEFSFDDNAWNAYRNPPCGMLGT